MLTFDGVLKSCEEFLTEDMATEVVKAVHGYIVMFWDKEREEYDFFDLCHTPEELMNELVESYGSYLSWLVCVNKDDPTAEEQAVIAEKQAVLLAKCLASADKK